MTYESIQPVLDWVRANPNWSGLAVFLISVSESLAIIGLIVPGVVLMTAIGTMMGAGILPFYTTLTWAILGAIVGDGISYWLGYRYNDHLRSFWPFRQFPQLLRRGEVFFENHGGKSIIFGRFVGPVRPMIPVIAGMMEMHPKRFLFFNVLSAIAWAPLYSLPGILIGVSLGSLSPEVASRIGVLVLLFLLFLWCIYEVLLLISTQLKNIFQWCLNILWRIFERFPLLHTLLRNQQGTEQGQLAVLILFLLSAFGFTIVYYDVWYSFGVSDWNEPVYHVLRALYAEKFIYFISMLTGLGAPGVLLPPTLAIGLCLLWRKRFIAGLCWLGTIGFGYLATIGIKAFTTIPRPDGLVYFSEKFAFPSGHTVTTVIFFGLAAVFLKKSLPKKIAYIPFASALLLIFLVAFSRLYLGLHWFTDTLGGISLGVVFLAGGAFLYRRLQKGTIPAREILIPGLIVFAVTFTYYGSIVYPETKKEYTRQWAQIELNSNEWWSGTGQTNDLYRTGAFKPRATVFNIQWLGTIDEIQKSLIDSGWVTVPKLTPKSSLLFLSEKTDPLVFPVLPKFHHDRLPIIRVAHQFGEEKRLVLQLWQSNYFTATTVPLLVGTLRVEEANHPLPMVTIYLEMNAETLKLKQLSKTLMNYPQIRTHSIRTKNNHQQKVLLLKFS